MRSTVSSHPPGRSASASNSTRPMAVSPTRVTEPTVRGPRSSPEGRRPVSQPGGSRRNRRIGAGSRRPRTLWSAARSRVATGFWNVSPAAVCPPCTPPSTSGSTGSPPPKAFPRPLLPPPPSAIAFPPRGPRAPPRLTHLNVVSVYDQGAELAPDGHHVFLVMELVE